MKIFSINFGHDASLCLFENGKVLDFVEVERESRMKHHFGLHSSFIKSYLARHRLNFSDFDLIALSGTQQWAAFHSSDLKIEFGSTLEHHKWAPPAASDFWTENNFSFFNGYAEHIYGPQVDKFDLVKTATPLRVKWSIPITADFHTGKLRASQIVSAINNVKSDEIQTLHSHFLTPFTMKLDGVSKPAFFVDHHFAHANYSTYYSKVKSLALTHDGGVAVVPYNSGGVYVTDPKIGVIPVMSHGLTLGNIYDRVAGIFGIDAGKLMGLAAYSRPNSLIQPIIRRYIDSLFYGNTLDTSVIAQMIIGASLQDQNIKFSSFEKYTFDFQDPNLAIQSASNVQYFVQQVYSELMGEICECLYECDPALNQVFMTGGFALNCPTNTSMNQYSTVMNYEALPGVGDTGLALGAAVAVSFYSNVKINPDRILEGTSAAFPPSTFDHLQGSEDIAGLVPLEVEDIPKFICDEIINGSIICLHRSRSEVGPRALGNRSIIGWAGLEKNLNRINELKGREGWRPLAPICSEKDFHDYFVGNPEDCKYMLTVSKVKKRAIPAVTHVDNTARVQVIDKDDELLNSILAALKQCNYAPVLINTSFNCSGEPLVETFEDAKRSFLKMGFEYLYSEGRLYRPMK